MTNRSNARKNARKAKGIESPKPAKVDLWAQRKRKPTQTASIAEKEGNMGHSSSVLLAKIERIVAMSWRRTQYAKFQKPDGFYICEAWFQDGNPQMQIRSSAYTLEEAAIVATGIQMAIEWIVEETGRGGNVPTKPAQAKAGKKEA